MIKERILEIEEKTSNYLNKQKLKNNTLLKNDNSILPTNRKLMAQKKSRRI